MSVKDRQTPQAEGRVTQGEKEASIIKKPEEDLVTEFWSLLPKL